jgi:hypothetical protein
MNSEAGLILLSLSLSTFESFVWPCLIIVLTICTFGFV